jgi:hypothetical protein
MQDSPTTGRVQRLVARLEAKVKQHRDKIAFVDVVWQCFIDRQNPMSSNWEYECLNAVRQAYYQLCERYASECKTLDDFFDTRLNHALVSILGRKDAALIHSECMMVMEFPFRHSVRFPSYRSDHAGDYADAFFMAIFNALEFKAHGHSLKQALTASTNALSGLDNRLAMALRQGDSEIHKLVEEAIFGDNSASPMSHLIISAVVKSGNDRALDMLGRLLLAAKGQEGLRQAIVEGCSGGTLASHLYFIDLIMEHDLGRFSSVTRAFDSWTGLMYDEKKPRGVEDHMRMASGFLRDEGAIASGLDSMNGIEAYLALWAMGCRRVKQASQAALSLIASPQKHRRLVGWRFLITSSDLEYRHSLAVTQLHRRDLEELAWICSNLHINRKMVSYDPILSLADEQAKRVQTYYDYLYPTDAGARADLFDSLQKLAAHVGNKKMSLPSSVFPWCTRELDGSVIFKVMLGLAAYDRSDELTMRLAGLLPSMGVEQRQVYYELLLDPERAEHKSIMMAGLGDKSGVVRERIVNRLSYYRLDADDARRLADGLKT